MTEREQNVHNEMKEHAKSDYVSIPLSKHIELKVDWNNRGKEDVIHAKITESSGKVVDEIITAEDLWKAAFMLSNPKAQEELLPVESQAVREYYKTVRIRATKDIRKGEEIVARATFKIPELELYKSKTTQSGISIISK